MQQLLTAKDVAGLLQCSVPLVYKMTTDGRLACIRIPCPGTGTSKPRSLKRFRPSDVQSLIDDHLTITEQVK
ncbi:hypothetical protein DSCW_35590 [Desulfosarcina widdelii]|uniref:Helix-turn-helix domain-containing protein n=1 Tax=Desulfosarcina widdelii TaxID=947919 RepID=A0A5K7Z2A7_9BACT|nr:hypothetical protein DSCW_35590 [Desulfosarcina widdelii]